jgi:hypothetical protein
MTRFAVGVNKLARFAVGVNKLARFSLSGTSIFVLNDTA